MNNVASNQIASKQNHSFLKSFIFFNRDLKDLLKSKFLIIFNSIMLAIILLVNIIFATLPGNKETNGLMDLTIWFNVAFFVIGVLINQIYLISSKFSNSMKNGFFGLGIRNGHSKHRIYLEKLVLNKIVSFTLISFSIFFMTLPFMFVHGIGNSLFLSNFAINFTIFYLVDLIITGLFLFLASFNKTVLIGLFGGFLVAILALTPLFSIMTTTFTYDSNYDSNALVNVDSDQYKGQLISNLSVAYDFNDLSKDEDKLEYEFTNTVNNYKTINNDSFDISFVSNGQLYTNFTSKEIESNWSSILTALEDKFGCAHNDDAKIAVKDALSSAAPEMTKIKNWMNDSNLRTLKSWTNYADLIQDKSISYTGDLFKGSVQQKINSINFQTSYSTNENYFVLLKDSNNNPVIISKNSDYDCHINFTYKQSMDTWMAQFTNSIESLSLGSSNGFGTFGSFMQSYVQRLDYKEYDQNGLFNLIKNMRNKFSNFRVLFNKEKDYDKFLDLISDYAKYHRNKDGAFVGNENNNSNYIDYNDQSILKDYFINEYNSDSKLNYGNVTLLTILKSIFNIASNPFVLSYGDSPINWTNFENRFVTKDGENAIINYQAAAMAITNELNAKIGNYQTNSSLSGFFGNSLIYNPLQAFGSSIIFGSGYDFNQQNAYLTADGIFGSSNYKTTVNLDESYIKFLYASNNRNNGVTGEFNLNSYQIDPITTKESKIATTKVIWTLLALTFIGFAYLAYWKKIVK